MASPDHAAAVSDTLAYLYNYTLAAKADKGRSEVYADGRDALDALVADLERERALHVQMADKWQAEAGRLGAVEDELLARIATLEQERNGERAAKMIVQEDVRRLKRELGEALQANEGKANLALHDALIARADRYEKAAEAAIRRACDTEYGDTHLNLENALRDVVGILRAALAGEDA